MVGRWRDRGDGTVGYLGIIALVAAVAASAALVTGVPGKITSGASSAVCRVTGDSGCGTGDSAQEGGAAAAVTAPAGGAGAPPPSSPVPDGAGASSPRGDYDHGPVQIDDKDGDGRPDIIQEFDEATAENAAAQAEARSADDESGSLDGEVLRFLSELIGLTDAKNCLTKGDIGACLKAAAQAVPWGKAFKILKSLPKAYKLVRRFKSALGRVDAARKRLGVAGERFEKACGLISGLPRTGVPRGSPVAFGGGSRRPTGTIKAVIGVIAVSAPTAPQMAPSCFGLRKLPGPGDKYRSPGGLVYTDDDPRFGHRILHVLAHTHENRLKPNHTVFKTDKVLLELVDEAWRRRSAANRIIEDGRISYLIPMKDEIGTRGEKFLRIVVENHNELVTAYPQLTRDVA